MSRSRRPFALGTLQRDILQIVWSCDRPISARAVYDVLNEQRGQAMAYTTVQTTMLCLYDEQLLRRTPPDPQAEPRRHGAAYCYMLAVPPEQLSRAAVEYLLVSLGADDDDRQEVARLLDRASHAVTTPALLSVSAVIGPLERAILTAVWDAGPLRSNAILATLRQRRPIAHTTVTTTLSRLVARGLLRREGYKGTHQHVWRYTPCYASRGMLLAAAIEPICSDGGAEWGERAEALAVLLGAQR